MRPWLGLATEAKETVSPDVWSVTTAMATAQINSPQNLEILTRAEHLEIHNKPDPDRVAWRHYLETMP